MGIFETDARGSCLFVNARWCELAGMHEERARGDGWVEAIHPDDRERVARDWQDAVTKRGDFRSTYRFGNDARTVWVAGAARALRDEAGEITGYVGTITDLTEEKRLETRLRHAERDLRAMLANAPDAIAMHRNERVMWVNNAFVSLTGARQPSDLLDRSIFDFIHPGDADPVRARLGRLAQGPLTLEPSVARIRRADGSHALVEWRSSRATMDGAEVVISVGRDLTERNDLQARLALTDRLASLGTLSAGVAHEVNNPLAYVSANLEYLAEQVRVLGGGDPDDHVQEMADVIGEIKDGVERIRRIVRGLKAFARGDDDAPVAQCVQRTLDVAAHMVENEIRHRARLVREYGHAPLVLVGEGRLVQVFVNLLVNAAQAIPEGQADENRIVLVTRTDSDGNAVIEVRDSGVGIAERDLDRVFDPFFTTKEVGGGTGLGLSISHGIVAGAGGKIRVQSEVGRGTIFTVVLPPARSAAPRSQSSVRTTGPTPRARVLVIDDEPLVLRSIQRGLSNEHDVVVTTSGIDACRRLEAGDRFDVIFCDLMMPTLSGMDFHARVAASAPGEVDKIVFLTGGAFTSRSREFIERVPNACIDKPVDIDQLRAVIRQMTVKVATG